MGGVEVVIRQKWGVTINGYEVSFGDDKNVLKLIIMMVAQL